MTRFLIKRKNLDTETQRHAHRENAGEDESTDKKWSAEMLLQAKKHQRLQESTGSKLET